MKSIFFILLLLTVNGFIIAAEPINGVVMDAETKTSLPFTNIVVSGGHKGTVSNAEGFYILEMEGIAPTDTICFYYMGYETLKIKAIDLQHIKTVYLKPVTIKLGEVQVSSKQLNVNEIINLVKKNYARNYPKITQKREIFIHKFEKTPFPEENKIILKKSDFAGLDKQNFKELRALMPPEFIEYRDAVVELYSAGDSNKIVPVQAISLEEGSYKELGKEIESKLGVLFEDIEKTQTEEDVYYKMRSGIFSQKIEKNELNDSIWKENKNDPEHYTLETKLVKSDILFLLNDYCNIKSKNWDFINSKGQYHYKKEGLTSYNDEPVYKISFTPKNRGNFEGTMYVSMSTYAVLQLDFAYADGVQTQKFDLLGIEHSMNMKRGRVIFEKGKSGYFVKYVSAYQNEKAKVEREFSILKKEKRFLTDKELSEIKIELEVFFDINSSWELLVLDSKEITHSDFEAVKQPLLTKFKIEYAYTPEMWNNRTVLVPSAELKKLKRKE